MKNLKSDKKPKNLRNNTPPENLSVEQPEQEKKSGKNILKRNCHIGGTEYIAGQPAPIGFVDALKKDGENIADWVE